MAVKRRVDVRDAVVNSLMRTQNGSKFSNLELDAAIEKYDFLPKDKALFTALYYGVLERQITLDMIISRLSTRSIGKIDQRALSILRMALYQLIYMDRIPAHAAVSSAVELTHKGGTDGFVNAVLRSYLRDPSKFLPENMGLVGDELMSYKYSLPTWLLSMGREDYGAENAEMIAAASTSKPSITLRVNTLRTTREVVLERLEADGIDAEADPLCSTAIHLLSSCPIDRIAAIKTGEAFVQDMASQLCCRVLEPNQGETVFDVCCCPGGKSFSCAIEMNNSGIIKSFDLHKSKLSLVINGADALGISIIETAEQDGRIFMPQYDRSADRIICDVPCSGLGVISKKPDIRYKNPDEMEKLPKIQYDILKNSAEYLKVGGTLVYSTCTLRRAENENVIEQFVKEDNRFVFENFTVGGRVSENGCLTLFPYGGTDGFFISKIKRIK